MGKKRGLNDTLTVEETGALIETQETTNTQETGEIAKATIYPVETEDPDYSNVLCIAQEIKQRTDVIGYIIRGDEKATVELDDSAKIMEYAMLSAQAFESADALSSRFQIGATENVLVEGKKFKVLCIDLGQNKISIFMRKEADHSELLRKFMPQA
ncbi:MAG TPA: hypothetical protein VMD05_03670 [Candidatus Nanoarchaeia archaeon]|nr:hypothetical protein [Candidatus Nanoarchaeia archaeon]